MLDIAFYTADAKSEIVEISESFCQWLARSEFYKIGKSEPKVMKIDDEDCELEVVVLEGANRRKLSAFLRDEIVRESAEILDRFGDFPSKELYQTATLKLRKLQESRKYLENESYKYLERA